MKRSMAPTTSAWRTGFQAAINLLESEEKYRIEIK